MCMMITKEKGLEKTLVYEIGLGLQSCNYAFEKVENQKKYILDLTTLKDLSLEGVLYAFEEIYHEEWKYLLAAWLVFPIVTSLQVNNSEADISQLFNTNLKGETIISCSESIDISLDYEEIFETIELSLDCEEIRNILKPLFNVLRETDDTVYLALDHALI